MLDATLRKMYLHYGQVLSSNTDVAFPQLSVLTNTTPRPLFMNNKLQINTTKITKKINIFSTVG